MDDLNSVVAVRDGIVTTLSTDVATVFEKQHKDVIRAIENLSADLPEARKRNFALTFEIKQLGNVERKTPVYRLTRDGFMILAMGFTGKKAMEFKWAYIDAFNAMEKKLREGGERSGKITEYQQWELQKAVAKRAKNTAAHYQTIYHAIYNRFQIPRYTELKQRDFEDCIAFIEDVDLTVPTAEPAKPAELELPLEKKGGVYLTDSEADGFASTVYYFRHLFRPVFGTTYQFLRAVNSPMQKEFYDAVHEIGLATLAVQQTLARHGHDIKKDESYQNLASHRDPDQNSYFKATDISTTY